MAGLLKRTGWVSVATCSPDEAIQILDELTRGDDSRYNVSEPKGGWYVVGTVGPAVGFWDRLRNMSAAKPAAPQAEPAWWGDIYSGDPRPDPGPRYYHVVSLGKDDIVAILKAIRAEADQKGWPTCGLAIASMPNGTVWVGALGAESVIRLQESLQKRLGSGMPQYARTLPNGGHLKGTDPSRLQQQVAVEPEPGSTDDGVAPPIGGRLAGRLPASVLGAAARVQTLRQRFGRRSGG